MTRNLGYAATAAALTALSVGAVQASDIRLYGIIDTGIITEHNHSAGHSVKQDFGINLGPRLGASIWEDLGDNLKAHVEIENLFESDNGAMRFNRLFSGHAHAGLKGNFGEFSLGRMGSLSSPFGQWGIFGMEATPFGYGWGHAGGVYWIEGGDRVDNAVAYATPAFGNVTLYAQYSLETGEDFKAGEESAHTGNNNRRASLGVKYQTEKVTIVGVADQIWHPAPGTNHGLAGEKNTQILSLTTNFAVSDNLRLYVMGQAFKNAYLIPGAPAYDAVDLLGPRLEDGNSDSIRGRGFDGIVAAVSAKIQAGGGELLLTATYDRFKYQGAVRDGDQTKASRWLAGVAYDYPLSKRTHVYASANVARGTGLLDSKNFSDSGDPNAEQVMFGMTHFF